MASRARLILTGLSLAFIWALVAAPSAPIQADDLVRFDAPANGASVVGTIEVRGRAVTAEPSQFSFYRLHYGAGSSPVSLRPVGSPSEQPVENGVLGVWDTAPLFQGEYLLQLTVYDKSGGTATARVVVNVLPAPTPTPRNQPSVLVPVPGETPTAPEDDTGPTPTPLPELVPLIPQIPQIDIPQESPGQFPVQPVEPPPPAPGFQPIQIDPGIPSSQPPAPLPGPPAPSSAPSFDPGPPIPPPPAPLLPANPVGPPPPPIIAPFEPQPTLSLPPTPTLFGLPP